MSARPSINLIRQRRRARNERRRLIGMTDHLAALAIGESPTHLHTWLEQIERHRQLAIEGLRNLTGGFTCSQEGV